MNLCRLLHYFPTRNVLVGAVEVILNTGYFSNKKHKILEVLELFFTKYNYKIQFVKKKKKGKGMHNISATILVSADIC